MSERPKLDRNLSGAAFRAWYWLKSNAGKKHRDAVEAYKEIKKDKGGRKTIDSQFEYNTYIRDFFEHNPGHPLEEAIRCWKYKKSQPGSHKYEDSDLTNSIIK
jgi:hypothetical protein